MISVIVISRKRHEILNKCLSSIRNKSNNVEIIVGYDFDDEEIKNIAINYGCNVYGSNRDINRHKTFLNPICRKLNSKYFFGLNDDTEILTDNFDKVIIDYAEEFLADKSDRILYGICNENWQIGNAKEEWEEFLKYKYACYPIITKETFDCLDFFMPENVSGPGADIKYAEIFSKICKNRTLSIPVSIFDHAYNDGQSNNNHYNMFSINDLNESVRKINESINNIS